MNEIKWTLKTFKLSELKDYEHNPRKLTKDQYSQLKESLQEFGLIDKPICTQDGRLIGGHQRKRVLEDLAVKDVECYVPNVNLTEKQIRKLNIRLNKAQGDWDWDILGDQFEVEDLIEWGFSEKDLLGSEEKPEAEIASAGEEKEPIKCPACGHQFVDAK